MGGAWGAPEIRPVQPSRGIWGDYDGKKMGLPFLVSFLERHGLAGTFFVTPFLEEQGYPDDGEPICQYLLEHGQDVQLHIHPNHKHYGLYRRGQKYPFTDQIAELSAGAQRELLQEGAHRMEQWTGSKPVAFRAGNMGASEETLKQLEAVGIPIDSSYSFPYVGKQCLFEARELYNGSKWYGNVLELALSGCQQLRFPGLRPAQPLDLMGISYQECRKATELICAAGAHVVMILHSFSLFKVRNQQFEGGRLNRINTQRFRNYCNWLAARGLPVYTFGDAARAIADGTFQACHVPPCKLRHPRALVRRAIQGWNNLYWT